ANEVEVGTAPRGRERQDFSLAPAVGRGQFVHVAEQAPGPITQLLPEKAGCVERRFPHSRALRALQSKGQIGARVRFAHALAGGIHELIRNSCGTQVASVGRGSGVEAELEETTSRGRGVAFFGGDYQVLRIRETE